MAPPQNVGPAPRVRPSALAGLGVFVVYLVVIVAIQSTSGVDYDDLAASTGTIWRNGILSIAVGGAVVAALTIWFGWWRAALVDRVRSRRRWTLLAPALVLVMALGNLVVTDWSALSVGYVASAVLLAVCVGFAEELTCRGALLVGLRGSTREVVAWILTCVVFGAMHGLNVLFGAEVSDTVQQVVLAGAQGSAFYVLRRVTGSLVWAMVLHGLWDFAIFVDVASDGGTSILSILQVPVAVLALVAGFVVARDTQRRAAPVEATTSA